jgi:hypothetical protein
MSMCMIVTANLQYNVINDHNKVDTFHIRTLSTLALHFPPSSPPLLPTLRASHPWKGWMTSTTAVLQ